jgi:hypothetical protein
VGDGGQQLTSVGVPEPGVEERRTRRRWAWGLVAGLAVVLAGSVAGVLVGRPEEATGYGPRLEEQVSGWCRRSGGDDSDGSRGGACACAYEALASAVPFERLREVDDQLDDGEELPPDLRSVVAPCAGDR